jgi:SAM-dependent methyltransferase
MVVARAPRPTMTAVTEARYDSIAEGYARWWGPVIRPAAEALLDHLDLPLAANGSGDVHLLDLGTGTGTLAIAALRRWPTLRVTGIDVSAEMLALAERTAGDHLAPGLVGRFERRIADAAALPYPDATFDAAMSSFVLQLVDSRAAALREIRRVLRPGGAFAWVTWLRGGEAYAPDRIVNEVLDEAGFDPPEPDPRSGDPASTGAAAAAMRRAGFRDVRATSGELRHRWDAAGYLEFFSRFDEASLFDDLEVAERSDILGRMLERLSSLDEEALTLRLPVVYVTGRAA